MWQIGQQCSTMFKNVQQSSAMFNNVHQCSTMFNNVHQCSTMFTNVHQCSTMFNNVTDCSAFSSFVGQSSGVVLYLKHLLPYLQFLKVLSLFLYLRCHFWRQDKLQRREATLIWITVLLKNIALVALVSAWTGAAVSWKSVQMLPDSCSLIWLDQNFQ